MNIFRRWFILFINCIRPLLGPSGCCIYPITCRDFARYQLSTQPLYKALFRITIRVVSCNPLTPLWWAIKKNKYYKNLAKRK